MIYYMKCSKCGSVFNESELQLSHDVPKYLFNGNKEIADKLGRHYLCKTCHQIYEWKVITLTWNAIPEDLQEKIIEQIKLFRDSYFKNG